MEQNKIRIKRDERNSSFIIIINDKVFGTAAGYKALAERLTVLLTEYITYLENSVAKSEKDMKKWEAIATAEMSEVVRVRRYIDIIDEENQSLKAERDKAYKELEDEQRHVANLNRWMAIKGVQYYK